GLGGDRLGRRSLPDARRLGDDRAVFHFRDTRPHHGAHFHLAGGRRRRGPDLPLADLAAPHRRMAIGGDTDPLHVAAYALLCTSTLADRVDRLRDGVVAVVPSALPIE